MKHRALIRDSWITIFSLMLVASLFGAQKEVIEKRDDLPRYTYQIREDVVAFLNDEEAVLELADAVERDLEADLEAFIIKDKTTLQEFYAHLGTIALLEKRWDDYLEFLEKRVELEDKEAARYTKGMVGKIIAEGRMKQVSDMVEFVRSELLDRIESMPYPVVEANLKSSKGQAEIISESLVLGSLESGLGPMLQQTGGEISRDVATQLLGAAYTLNFFLPVKDVVHQVLTRVIDANQVEKEDIWEARSVTLPPQGDFQEVVLAVWDSGVDTGIFTEKNQVWVNQDEIEGNQKDDDGNGFVDDVHGIAYSLHSEKVTELLRPIGEMNVEEDLLRRYMKGLSDIQSSIDSAEARELRQELSQMQQSEVKPFIESVSLYSGYAHGTHVAGIAAAGNPYARILVARITFDHRMIPETPTIEQAKKDAAASWETVEYFRNNGVRAVNMSWGGSVADIEAALEKNAAGGAPEERKALAREIFSIYDRALREAIEGSPEILFITSAGNSNNDVRFDEFLPSSYDYPNILSVGAVDQAGDETSFTSFGKVDVYANGFEVLSYVPGGVEMRMNGTSMSAPQVLNLAGKLLAAAPDLTVAQLRALIEKGCEEKQAGDRKVKLIHPRRSMQLLDEM